LELDPFRRFDPIFDDPSPDATPVKCNTHDRADAYLLRHLWRNEIVKGFVDGRHIGTHAYNMLIGQVDVRNGSVGSNRDLNVRLL
jgi:hypothetical protein